MSIRIDNTLGIALVSEEVSDRARAGIVVDPSTCGGDDPWTDFERHDILPSTSFPKYPGSLLLLLVDRCPSPVSSHIQRQYVPSEEGQHEGIKTLPSSFA